MNALRPGSSAFRIHYPDSGKAPRVARCIVVRIVNSEFISVRASTFSRDFWSVPLSDVFPDREACRAEIQRRADGMKETPNV
jgi:hypothetical protein